MAIKIAQVSGSVGYGLPACCQTTKTEAVGISFAKMQYRISQDQSDGEDSCHSDLFASFRRIVQKQSEIQTAPIDLFHAEALIEAILASLRLAQVTIIWHLFTTMA